MRAGDRLESLSYGGGGRGNGVAAGVRSCNKAAAQARRSVMRRRHDPGRKPCTQS